MQSPEVTTQTHAHIQSHTDIPTPSHAHGQLSSVYYSKLCPSCLHIMPPLFMVQVWWTCICSAYICSFLSFFSHRFWSAAVRILHFTKWISGHYSLPSIWTKILYVWANCKHVSMLLKSKGNHRVSHKVRQTNHALCSFEPRYLQ